MKLEDLEVWKRAARLSANIYKELKDLKDFGFKDQITRSGLSVPSNIAEGFERRSDKDFSRFLYISKGSCGEVRSMVALGLELGYLTKDEHSYLHKLSLEISRMLSGFIKALK